MSFAWSLVGREEELALLLEPILGDSFSAAVVAGPPGVGKSRLIDEALARAAATGAHTELVRASGAAASIPLGAFASLPPLSADPGTGRIGLIREAAAALRERAAGRRFVLGVDDAHLLDDASAALVGHLAETGEAFVLAGVRSGEAAPDAVTKLWKDGAGRRLELASLPQEQTGELLEAMLGGPADGGTRQRIWEATAGNPLYLRELVLGAREAGGIATAGGVWHWQREAGVAPRLAELLEERLGALGGAEREALELVALAEPLELELFGALLPERALQAAERHGLAETREEGGRLTVRPSHPLYGELLRARMPVAAARAIKRRLAEALEQRGPRHPDDLLRLATWRLESGSATDPELLAAASARAASGFEFELAERLAAAAIEAGGGAAARHRLASALVGRGDHAGAERELAGAEAEATAASPARVGIAVDRAENLYWRLGEAEAAIELLRAAERSAAGEGERRRLLAARAGLLLFEGGTEEAVEIALGLLDPADPADPVTWQAARTVVWGCACAGRLDLSLEVNERLLALAASHPEEVPPFTLIWLRMTYCDELCFAGRFEQGLAAGYAAHEKAIAGGAEIGRLIHCFGIGWALQLQGDAAGATRWLREAVSGLREVDVLRHRSSAAGELAQVEALLGNLAAAEAALVEAEAARVERFRMDEWAVGLGRAWVAAARGETSAAIAAALDTATATGELGQRFLQAVCLHDALRLGELGVAAELAELAAGLDGPLAAAFAAHAGALAAGDGEALGRVSASFEAMRADLYAAEAAAEASRAFEAAGRAASARSAAARAAALRGRCEGVSTPALAALSAPALSRREREVATLAARGLSNREIAARLVVSVRTVENHLHSAYANLGVSSRDELGPLLGD